MECKHLRLILPHTSQYPYSATYWLELKSRLEDLQVNIQAETFIKFVCQNLDAHSHMQRSSFASDSGTYDSRVSKYLALAKSISYFDVSEHVLSLEAFVDELWTKWRVDFIAVVRTVVELVLSSEQLFADESKILDCSKGCLRLTRQQVACLLGHMLLCTLLRTADNESLVNFWAWLSSTASPTRAYLTVLCQYFQEYSFYTDVLKEEIIRFRHAYTDISSSPDWKLVDAPLATLKVLRSGSIGDEEGDIEVALANKDIGFGSNGTQEELMFGMSPELCVAVLFTDTLKENEALIVRGAKRIGDYQGYGLDVSFTGPCAMQRDWNSRAVVAIDALEVDPDLSHRDSLLFQLQDEHLSRELRKAFTGFSASGHDLCEIGENRLEHIAISTGAWGCGAFGGNLELKAIIQLMAATAAGVCLTYNCFGDAEFACKFESVYKQLLSRKSTVASLCIDLKAFEAFLRHSMVGVVPKSLFQWLSSDSPL